METERHVTTAPMASMQALHSVRMERLKRQVETAAAAPNAKRHMDRCAGEHRYMNMTTCQQMMMMPEPAGHTHRTAAMAPPLTPSTLAAGFVAPGSFAARDSALPLASMLTAAGHPSLIHERMLTHHIMRLSPLSAAELRGTLAGALSSTDMRGSFAGLPQRRSLSMSSDTTQRTTSSSSFLSGTSELPELISDLLGARARFETHTRFSPLSENPPRSHVISPPPPPPSDACGRIPLPILISRAEGFGERGGPSSRSKDNKPQSAYPPQGVLHRGRRVGSVSLDEIGALNVLMEEYDDDFRSTPPLPTSDSESGNEALSPTKGSCRSTTADVRDEEALAAKRKDAQAVVSQVRASSRTASLDECNAVGSLLTL